MKIEKLEKKIDLTFLREFDFIIFKIKKKDDYDERYYDTYRYKAIINKYIELESYNLKFTDFNNILLAISNNDIELLESKKRDFLYKLHYQLIKNHEEIYYCNIYFNDLEYFQYKLKDSHINMIKRLNLKIDIENIPDIISW